MADFKNPSSSSSSDGAVGTLSGVLNYICDTNNTVLTNGSFGTISGMVSQNITLTAGTYIFQITADFYAVAGSIGALQFSAFVNSTEVSQYPRDAQLISSSVQQRTSWTSTTIVLTAGSTAIIPHVKATTGNGRMDSGYNLQIAVFKIA